MRKIFNIIAILFIFMYGTSIAQPKVSEYLNKKFLDFPAFNEQGKVVKLSDVAGHGKPVVFIFWAYGDRDTFKLLPKLNYLLDKYKGKVIFIAGLLSRSNLKEVQKAKKLIPLKFPVWLVDYKAAVLYNIRKVDVPLILYIDGKGYIKNIIVRPKSVESVEKYVKELIKE